MIKYPMKLCIKLLEAIDMALNLNKEVGYGQREVRQE